MQYCPDQTPRFRLDVFSAFDVRITEAISLDIALPGDKPKSGEWSLKGLLAACFDRTIYLNRVLPAIETESAFPYLRRAADLVGCAPQEVDNRPFAASKFEALNSWRGGERPLVTADIIITCPGHIYKDRANEDAPPLQFLRRASKAIAYETEFEGVNTQQILCAAIFRLREGVIAAAGTDRAIDLAAAVECLREVVFFYECRAWVRKQQKKNRLDGHVFEDERMTMPPFVAEMIEDMPTGDDGHIDVGLGLVRPDDLLWLSQEEAEIWSDIEARVADKIYGAAPFSPALAL